MCDCVAKCHQLHQFLVSLPRNGLQVASCQSCPSGKMLYDIVFIPRASLFG